MDCLASLDTLSKASELTEANNHTKGKAHVSNG